MRQAIPSRLASDPVDLVGSEHHSADLQLHPMTAEQLSSILRSSSTTVAGHTSQHLFIPLGLYSLTPSPSNTLPPGWKELVLPGGQHYFYHPLRRIITRSDIKDRTVLLILVQALVILKSRLALPETAEIILYVDPNSRIPCVRYYAVDHAQRIIFWLEDTTTESSNIPPVTSFDQSKHFLKQQYWFHIGSHPMHHKLSDDVRVDLIAILNRPCAGYMSSSPPTIPYTQEQCETLLNLLNELLLSDRVGVHHNYTLARLWSEIEFHYFITSLETTPNLTRVKRTRRFMNFSTGTAILMS